MGGLLLHLLALLSLHAVYASDTGDNMTDDGDDHHPKRARWYVEVHDTTDGSCGYKVGAMTYSMDFAWAVFGKNGSSMPWNTPGECVPCMMEGSVDQYYCKAMLTDEHPCGAWYYFNTSTCSGMAMDKDTDNEVLEYGCVSGFGGSIWGYDVQGKCVVDDEDPDMGNGLWFNLDLTCLDAVAYWRWNNASNTPACAVNCTQVIYSCDDIGKEFGGDENHTGCLSTCDDTHPDILDWAMANPVGIRADCHCRPTAEHTVVLQAAFHNDSNCSGDPMADAFNVTNYVDAMSRRFRGGLHPQSCYEGQKVILDSSGCPVEWNYSTPDCRGMAMMAGPLFDHVDMMMCDYDGIPTHRMANNMTMYQAACVLRNDSMVMNATNKECVDARALVREPDWKCFEYCMHMPMTCKEAMDALDDEGCAKQCMVEDSMNDLVLYGYIDCECLENYTKSRHDDDCDMDDCQCNPAACPYPMDETTVIAIFRDMCGANQSLEGANGLVMNHVAFMEYAFGWRQRTCYPGEMVLGLYPNESFWTSPTTMGCGSIWVFNDLENCAAITPSYMSPLIGENGLLDCLGTPAGMNGTALGHYIELHCVDNPETAMEEAKEKGAALLNLTCFDGAVLIARENIMNDPTLPVDMCLSSCNFTGMMSCEEAEKMTMMGGCAENCSSNFSYNVLRSMTHEHCGCDIHPPPMNVIYWEFAGTTCAGEPTMVTSYNASTWAVYMIDNPNITTEDCIHDGVNDSYRVGLDANGCPMWYRWNEESPIPCELDVAPGTPGSYGMPMGPAWGSWPYNTCLEEEGASKMYTCQKYPPHGAKDLTCLKPDVANKYIAADQPACTTSCATPMSCEEANMVVQDGACASSCDRQEVFDVLLQAGFIDCECEIPEREMYFLRKAYLDDTCSEQTLFDSVAWPVDYVWNVFIEPLTFDSVLVHRLDCEYHEEWGVYISARKVSGCYHMTGHWDRWCVTEPIVGFGGPIWPTSEGDMVCSASGDMRNGMPVYEKLACVATFDPSMYRDLSCVVHAQHRLDRIDWNRFYGDPMNEQPNVPPCAQDCLSTNLSICQDARAMFWPSGCAFDCEDEDQRITADVVTAFGAVPCDCDLRYTSSSTSMSSVSTATSATSETTVSTTSTSTSATTMTTTTVSSVSSVSSASSVSTASTESSTSTASTPPTVAGATTTTTTTPTQAQIDGNLNLNFENDTAEDFVTSYENDNTGEVEMALQEAVAAPLEGIDAEDVNITGVTVEPGNRRLKGRMLTNMTTSRVVVSYTIIVPTNYSGTPQEIATTLEDTAAATAIQESLNLALPPQFQVTEITVQADVVTTTSTTRGPASAAVMSTRSMAFALAAIMSVHKMVLC